LIVKFNVAVFTQPDVFNEVQVYEPEAVYDVPLHDHVYELHAVAVKLEVVLLLIVKFNVAVFTQPAAFNEVQVYEPEAVYEFPLHDHV
jgi:hypothetical protein